MNSQEQIVNILFESYKQLYREEPRPKSEKLLKLSGGIYLVGCALDIAGVPLSESMAYAGLFTSMLAATRYGAHLYTPEERAELFDKALGHLEEALEIANDDLLFTRLEKEFERTSEAKEKIITFYTQLEATTGYSMQKQKKLVQIL